MTLSPREIEDRFEEAALTLRRLPEKDRPRGFHSAWPEIVRDPKQAYGYDAGKPMRVVPSAAAITRMEECFDWLLWLDPEDARIVWLRAENMRWKQICIRAGVARSTAWRRWVAALVTISKKLDAEARAQKRRQRTAQSETLPFPDREENWARASGDPREGKRK